MTCSFCVIVPFKSSYTSRNNLQWRWYKNDWLWLASLLRESSILKANERGRRRLLAYTFLHDLCLKTITFILIDRLVSQINYSVISSRESSVSFGVWLLFFHPTELQLNASLFSKPALQFTSESLMLSPHVTGFTGYRGGPAAHSHGLLSKFGDRWKEERKSYSEVREGQHRLWNKVLTRQNP